MGAKTYIGVSGVARQVKKMYVGVSGVARQVKKAYIGVGGVARCIYSADDIEYYGAITSLTTARFLPACANTTDYAIFMGGNTSDYNTDTSAIDAYNKSLTKTAISNSNTRSKHVGATIGSYAVFIPGMSGTTSYNIKIQTIDNSLTLSTLSAATFLYPSSTTVGSYAIIHGGNGSSSGKTMTINTSLTISYLSSSKTFAARYFAAATSIGSYAIFAGGDDTNQISYSQGEGCKDVHTYNTSLTLSTASDLSHLVRDHGATTVGNYAIFGGRNLDTYSSGMPYYFADAYNSSLTKTAISPVCTSSSSTISAWWKATTVGNYAVFMGSYGPFTYNPVTSFDTSLTACYYSFATTKRACFNATTIGSYALFGGGYTYTSSTYTPFSTVEAFTAAN